ncbi:hypothetical protein JYG23_10655 [Sedimentibacter sp. zth1]|uniref:hypothetical protein n=1 Tax=Sedimentibacter sp. zth1 TaxID=2816908 RepID=UPI001A92C6E5|nr:hypothetical protein [Sedimentibacter sp. zth1]QSX05140.1 hypothetical protein JYG23_10655 [Sedimentibacter sp. zth1]
MSYANFQEMLEIYLTENPKTGYITFQVYHDSPIYGIQPVTNAKVTVSKLIGDEYYVSKVLTTDIDGKTDPLPLPTVSGKLSTTPGNPKIYSEYNACIEAPNFFSKDVFDISVFENITSMQSINLLPNTMENTNANNKRDQQSLCGMW